MHQNSMVNNYFGRPDSFPTEDERQYTSKKEEGQWRWERDAQQMSPQLYSAGQGGNAGRSFYPNQMPDTKMSSNQEQRVHPQEQDMEVGYEDNPVPQNLERLDQKFHSDIMKFIKEQNDAEDAETARHRKKIIEINNQYQEKLSALRAKHATLREELLQRESQARLQTYQLAGMTPYQNNSGPVDMNQVHHGPHGYGAPDMAPGEPRRQFGGRVEFDSYRERHESFGRGRIQGTDTRVPTPGGRVYDTGPRYY
ncbi:uncharacterized protein LOC110712457 [Chenopodium quinoa]|nr:uncharacterized protein LOC110712457 [Chenopodium quinoa]XP_021746618.1 uncharacterized protein LOC110712457 [Chenopodium quinoa]